MRKTTVPDASPFVTCGYGDANPHFDWSTGKTVSWSSSCYSSCLQAALHPVEITAFSSISESADLSTVLAEYPNLGEVFSKQSSLSLAPHQPYNYTINLLPGTTHLLTVKPILSIERSHRGVHE